MNTIDTVCRRLRDVGLFLLGVAAVTMTVHYLYVWHHSPERKMQQVIQQQFTQDLEKAFAERGKK